ncbi:MAG: GNAT family N-acetyltransferase [Acidimicrobiia bacterium]
MRTAGSEVIAWGAERARAAPWRGEADVAALTPMPDAPVPTAAFVRRCLAELTNRGYRRVVTSALAPAEQLGFLAAGFTVSEQLHLLSHDLHHIAEPHAPGVRLARASHRMDSEVLALDALAFDPFWRLDSRSLRDAVGATPSARFRVARTGGELVGYAITGRAGRRGYVQRLAVAPDRQRQGIGTALVIDGLRWLRRRRSREALVNTQLGNEAALRLYESLGFRRQPAGLSVLEIDL